MSISYTTWVFQASVEMKIEEIAGQSTVYMPKTRTNEGLITCHIVAGVDSIGGQDQVEGASQCLWCCLVDIPCLQLTEH